MAVSRMLLALLAFSFIVFSTLSTQTCDGERQDALKCAAAWSQTLPARPSCAMVTQPVLTPSPRADPPGFILRKEDFCSVICRNCPRAQFSLAVANGSAETSSCNSDSASTCCGSRRQSLISKPWDRGNNRRRNARLSGAKPAAALHYR